MKRRSRRFNDEYYCQTVEDFEDKTFADRACSAGFMWALIMLWPVLAIGLTIARSDRRMWFPCGGQLELLGELPS
jgi:hypothetical protein